MPLSSSLTSRLLHSLGCAYRAAGLTKGSVLLAVSGGTDSTALLLATAHIQDALGLKVEVATLNHGLRAEAAEEVASVFHLSQQQGFLCHTRALGLKDGPDLEGRARTVRYDVLESLRQERALDCVVTAHTASDQAETLLMRLMRGSSLKGAGSIQTQRPHLLRPLLGFTRAELEAFVAEQGAKGHRDVMNEDPRFLRARVRHRLLPDLAQVAGFDCTQQLARFASLAAEDEALLSSLSAQAALRLRLPDGAYDAVGVRALEAPLKRRLLAQVLEEEGVPLHAASLQKAEATLATGRPSGFGGGRQLEATGGRLRWVRPRADGLLTPPLQVGPELKEARHLSSGWSFFCQAMTPARGTTSLSLDGATRWPLSVRTRLPGDRVQTPVGRRKLQDLFVDARVPREERGHYPVVTDGSGAIIWVPGLYTFPSGSPPERFLCARAPSGTKGESL